MTDTTPHTAAARVATDSDDALMAREMYESQDDSLLLCASDLQHSAIYDNHIEMQSCIRAVADRITALASVIAGVERAALAAPAQAGWCDGCSPDNCGGCAIPAAAAPAPASQPVAAPAGMEPVAWIEVHPGLDGWFLAYSFNPDAKTEPLYTAAQVQAMLAAAPRNATLYSPDDVAFPVQRCADGTDALPPELASIAAAEVAAAPKGGQHGTE